MENKKKKTKTMVIATSAVAIALIFGVIGYQSATISKTNSETIKMADEQIPLGIRNLYSDALDKYAVGNMSHDQLQELIAQSIKDYMTSSDFYTDEQIDVLNDIISSYLDNTTIYSDINKNKDSINAISNLLEERYAANIKYMSDIEQALSALIAANTDTDNARYSSLVKTDEDLRSYLDDVNSGLAVHVSNTDKRFNSLSKEIKTLLSDTNNDTLTLIKTITGAADYKEGTDYKKGDYILYNDEFYIAKEDTASLDGFAKTDIENIIRDLEFNMTTSFNDMQVYVDEINKTLNAKIDANKAETDVAIEKASEDAKNNLNAYKEATAKYLDELEAHISSEDTALKEYVDDAKAALDSDVDDTNIYISNVERAMNLLNEVLSASDLKLEEKLTKEATDRTNAYNALSETLTTTANDLQSSIDNVSKTSSDNLEDAKTTLKALINGNSELDTQTKNELLTLINNSNLKTAKDLQSLTTTLNNTINTKVSELQKKINQVNNYNYNLVTNSDGTHTLYITDAPIK